MRAVVVAALVAVAPVLAGCGDDDEAPRCADPQLRVIGDGAAGERELPADGAARVTVTGAAFGRGCVPPGDAVQEDLEDVEPFDRVQIFLRQGTKVTSVARVAPDETLGFRVTFGLPPGYSPGPAEIVAVAGTDPDRNQLATIELILGDG